MAETLEQIEDRVGEKWAAAAASRLTPLPGPFDFTDWTDWAAAETQPPADVPQFPREQWASYPTKRAAVMLLCDRLLDMDLTEEQWLNVCFLMQYGGKTRLV